jgi:hypothetical protein
MNTLIKGNFKIKQFIDCHLLKFVLYHIFIISFPYHRECLYTCIKIQIAYKKSNWLQKEITKMTGFNSPLKDKQKEKDTFSKTQCS